MAPNMLKEMLLEVVIEHLNENKINFIEINSFSKNPGIYAVFFFGEKFPIENYIPNDNEIIYLGKTESSQEKRDAKTHFKSGKTGSSTLRKTIGSLLKTTYKLKPIPRNKTDFSKKRFGHFRFDDKSEEILTKWMQNNLALSFFEYHKSKIEIEELETLLIQKIMPVFNINKNKLNPFIRIIKKLRKETARLAFEDYKIFEKNDLIERGKVNKMSPVIKDKYILLWQTYIPQILRMLSESNKPQSIQLNKDEFSVFGNRKSYSFNLEYKNGFVNNNIDGSAVARDLDKVISKSEAIRSILKKGEYKINLDRYFVLHVQRIR